MLLESSTLYYYSDHHYVPLGTYDVTKVSIETDSFQGWDAFLMKIWGLFHKTDKTKYMEIRYVVLVSSKLQK